MHATFSLHYLTPFLFLFFLSLVLCPLVSLILLISTYSVKLSHLLCSNQTHMVWWVSLPAAHSAANTFGCECVCHCGCLLCKPHRARKLYGLGFLNEVSSHKRSHTV